jgi:ABC-2 type transport system permease protein/lipopolysaccharide transport system permease protein
MERTLPGDAAAEIPVRVKPGEALHELPDAPPPELRYRRPAGLVRSARELWRNRELLRSLVERDLRSRYKQATLGFLWALVPPVSLLLVFVVLANHLTDINTNGVPYALFAFLGLLGWTFFSAGVNGSAMSLVSNAALLNKVACPRELFPLGTIAVAAVDTCIAALVLPILFVANDMVPQPASIYVPLLLVIEIAFTVGVGLMLSVLVVYQRDLRHALSLVLQLGLLLTPVAYGFDEIPSGFRWIYSLVNPLGPVIDGYRRTMLENEPPQWLYTGLGALGATFFLVFGFWLLRRLEGGIVDVS